MCHRLSLILYLLAGILFLPGAFAEDLEAKGYSIAERSDHTESHLHWVWDGSTWQDLAPIPTARNSATGGWIGDLLVVTGGRTASGNLADTEIYDKNTDTWRAAAPMPLPQAGTASVVVDDSLIVFGCHAKVARNSPKATTNSHRL